MLNIRRKRDESVFVGDDVVVTFRGFAGRGTAAVRLDVDRPDGVATAVVRQGTRLELADGVAVEYDRAHASTARLAFDGPRSVRIERAEVRVAREAGISPKAGMDAICPNRKRYVSLDDARKALRFIREDRGAKYAEGRRPYPCPKCARYHLSRATKAD